MWPVSRVAWLTAWLQRLRSRAVVAGRSPRTYTLIATLGVLLYGVARMLGPMVERWDTFGFHDWDVATAYRYITTVSLLEYGEAPWWHPWLCGGFPAFGYVEGATNFLSPYLPVYLLTDVQVAIRVEVIGATLTGALGAFLLAGRFTRSFALRAFVAALFVLNGRWSLQLATGHTWHLQFCWLPWALYFFERAQAPRRWHEAIYAAVFVALMGLFGGIYPLPYTALTLTVYAVLLAAFRLSLRPLLTLAIIGPVSFGLAAPKLLAVVDGMSVAPRLIESPEVIGIAELLVMLTDQSQRFNAFPVRVPAYNWHEWGIYIGTAPLVALALGVLFARGAREHSLKILGLLYLLMGLGAFHPRAPWTLLHQVPVFSSLHVPSRFHLVMVLLLALVFVAWVAPTADRWVRRQPWLDLVLLVPVLLIVLDVTWVSRRPVAQAFWMEAPASIERAERFEHRFESSVNYRLRDWAPPVLLPMMANTGVIRCYGVPESFPIGAQASDGEGYSGMVSVVEGEGRAEIVKWTPNRAVVQVHGASPGALLVYNMNFAPNWRANGEPALVYQNKVAVRLRDGVRRVEFRYFPRSLYGSVPIFLLTLAGSVGVLWWRRRDRRDSRGSGAETAAAAAGSEAQPR